jgi:hypothetical protein
MDWESFYLNARCFVTFYPRLNESLFMNYYLQYPTRPELFDRLYHFYRIPAFTIVLRSAEKALHYVLDIFQLFPAHRRTAIKFHFMFDYRGLFTSPITEGPLIVTGDEALALLTGNIPS